MMKRSILVGFAALAVVSSACGDSSGGDQAEFKVLPLDGPVELFDDGKWVPIAEESSVARGDKVRSGVDGRARIELPGGQSLELAAEASVHLLRPNTVEVSSGRVLAEATKGLTVMLGDVRVVARDAVFRVGRGIAQEIAVYQGSASVPGSGYELPILALEQLGIVGTTALRAPRPLVVDEQDPWDTRFLGDAIDIGVALAQQETGLASQLDGKFASRSIVQVLEGDLPPELLRELLRETLPEQIVIAAMVAQAIETGTADELLSEILELRAQGASWVVIAGRWSVGTTVIPALGAIVDELAALAISGAREPRPGDAQTPRIGGTGSAPGAAGGGAGSSASTDRPSTPKKKKKNSTPQTPGSGGGGGGSDPVRNPEPDPKPIDPDPGCTGSTVDCAIEGVIGSVTPIPGT